MCDTLFSRPWVSAGSGVLHRVVAGIPKVTVVERTDELLSVFDSRLRAVLVVAPVLVVLGVGAGLHNPLVQWAALPIGLLTGVLAVWPGIRLATTRLERRAGAPRRGETTLTSGFVVPTESSARTSARA